jgi:hypothetical protein
MSVVEFLGITLHQNNNFYYFNMLLYIEDDSTVNVGRCENIK